MKRVVPCIIVLLALSGCASFEHTGGSVGANVKVMDGVWINTNQIFKKKRD